MKTILFLLTSIITTTTYAKLDYHSERIKMMDVEQLQVMVSRNLSKIEQTSGSPNYIIKKSLELVLAQPDQRLAATRIFSQLRTLSREDKYFVEVLNEISQEGISSLKKKGKQNSLLREQNSYLFILNHMLAELQRDVELEHFRKVILKIRDARIRVSDALVSYRLLNSMSEIENPSKFANKIVPRKRPWYKFW